jgi:predicted PurR-regulated permease PerM
MPRGPSQSDSSKIVTIVLVAVVVAALYFAQDVLLPLALATLLTFILAPWVDRLERWHLGRVASILLVVGAAFAALFAIGWIVGSQMVGLANDLPTYRQNIVARIKELKPSGQGTFQEIERTVETLSKEISGEKPKAKADETADTGAASPVEPADATDQSAEPEPIPVRIVEDESAPAPISLVGDIIPSAFGWLATLGVVIVFLIFMLLDREDLRNRFIRLIGPDQINTTTQALDDAGRRVSRYLRMQLLINVLYGVMIGLGLFVIGLPNALLWGLLAGLLRYVPYVGPVLGAAIGILLSLAVFPGWWQPLAAVALFVVAELIVNNVLEPVLYHTSTGISAVGIILAAVFWTWLWGPVGLLLSTPLTVCIVVLGRYVPQLEFLHVMLSAESALPPGAHLYQRLLAGDEEESRELVEAYLKQHPVDELFEHVLLPALVYTEQDAHRGTLEESRREYILDNVRDLLDELPELTVPAAEADATEKPARASSGAIVIVPARDEADEIAGLILGERLEEVALEAQVLSAKLLFGEVVEAISRSSSPIVVVSAVPPYAARHARGLAKRLRSRLDGPKILVAIWGEDPQSQRAEARLRAAGADRVVHRLAAAVEYIDRYRASRAAPAGSEAAEALARGGES